MYQGRALIRDQLRQLPAKTVQLSGRLRVQQARTPGQVTLILQPVNGIKFMPVVALWIGLWRSSAEVVGREAEAGLFQAV